MNESNPRIIHVDDDADIREAVAWELAEVGLSVISIPDMNGALALIPDGLPNIVIAILDHDLLPGTGEEIAARLRASGLEIIIIGLTFKDVDWADYLIDKSTFDCGGEVAALVKRLLEIDSPQS